MLLLAALIFLGQLNRKAELVDPKYTSNAIGPETIVKREALCVDSYSKREPGESPSGGAAEFLPPKVVVSSPQPHETAQVKLGPKHKMTENVICNTRSREDWISIQIHFYLCIRVIDNQVRMLQLNEGQGETHGHIAKLVGDPCYYFKR